MYPLRTLASAILVIFLAGCGGGGGGDAPAPAAASNAAPVVTVAPLAGPMSTRDTVALAGTASDDGGTPTALWSQIDGPAVAVIASPSHAATTATFPALGTYHLRLSATDGTLNGYADLTVSVIDPFITVAGVEFDTRHSTDPVFAAVDSPKVDLWYTEPARGPMTPSFRNHIEFSYAAGSNRSIPCVVLTTKTTATEVLTPANVSVFTGTMYLATATDGSVYCLKAHMETVTNGGVPWIQDAESTSDLTVVVKPLPASPVYPFTWTSFWSLRLTGSTNAEYRADPTNKVTFAYTAGATSPNGVPGCYQVALPIEGFDLMGTYSWYFFYNPNGQPHPILRWMYFKPGFGIIDYDGASLLAPSNG